MVLQKFKFMFRKKGQYREYRNNDNSEQQGKDVVKKGHIKSKKEFKQNVSLR